MRGAALFLLLIAGLINKQESAWINNYDKPLIFICPKTQSISYIKSQHHNRYEDRLWDIGCKETFFLSSECFWSPYVNNFDERFTFTCPTNYILTGMGSYHSNKQEDRRWRFYCCKGNDHCTSNCYWTTYVNCFDEEFHWYVPSHNYLVGAESYHHNRYEDRRWKFMYCAKENCNTVSQKKVS